MDLYIEESGSELLKKTKLLLDTVLDEKEKYGSYKKVVRKKIVMNLQISIKFLEDYIAKCGLLLRGNDKIQDNIDLAKSIIKLLEASLGTSNEKRFEEYYSDALNLLYDLKDIEDNRKEEKSGKEGGRNNYKI